MAWETDPRQARGAQELLLPYALLPCTLASCKRQKIGTRALLVVHWRLARPLTLVLEQRGRWSEGHVAETERLVGRCHDEGQRFSHICQPVHTRLNLADASGW
jgi:hypothetical protein